MTLDTVHFYNELKPFTDFSSFSDIRHYSNVPDDWYIVIIDIKGSIQAINSGQYKQVNGVCIATMNALINAMKPVQVPYVFCGDSATACFPESHLNTVKRALRAAKRMARKRFGLALRVGMIKVSEVRQPGVEVCVAKFQAHQHFQQAMLRGKGFDAADKKVKERLYPNPYQLETDASAIDNHYKGVFDGFECRWDEIASPHEAVAAVLIRSLTAAPDANNQLYKAVLADIDRIYGNEQQRHPLTPKQLSLTSQTKLLAVETEVQTAFRPTLAKLSYRWKLFLVRQLGNVLMKFGLRTGNTHWGEYKDRLIANTDYRKYDNTLHMIISGTVEQHNRLRATLENYRHNKQLAFGLHSAPASLITCVIDNYQHDHIHFLDITNGGYTMAARELKQQLNIASAPRNVPQTTAETSRIEV